MTNVNAQSSKAMLKEKKAKQMKLNKKRLDMMFQYPATTNLAMIHYIACKFGENSGESPSKCACCELPADTQDIPLCESTTPEGLFKANKYEIAEMSSNSQFKFNLSSTMFFSFIKMLIGYLLIRLVLVDIYNMTSSYVGGTYCQQNKQECTSTVITLTSSYNKSNAQGRQMAIALDVLNLIFTLASIAFFIFYQRLQYRISQIVDISNQTQGDFTILVQNIPLFLEDLKYKGKNKNKIQFKFQRRLKEIFVKKLQQWYAEINQPHFQHNQLTADYLRIIEEKRQPFRKDRLVRSINLCFDLTEIEILMALRQKVMLEQLNYEKELNRQLYSSQKQKEDRELIRHPQNKIQLINRKILQISRKFAQDNSVRFNLSHFVGKAFVSFQYQHFRDYFVQSYQQNTQFVPFGSQFLKITQAVDPGDVFWFNLKVKDNDRTLNVAFSYFILTVVLILAFLFLIAIQLGQSATSNAKVNSPDSQSVGNKILPIILSIVTSAINAGLSFLINSLTNGEKHSTQTNVSVSLLIKLVTMQFLNTTVIYFIFSFNTLQEIFGITTKEKDFLQAQGLVVQINSLIFVSGILGIILTLVDPGRLFKKIVNWFFYFRHSQNKQIKEFQIKLNQGIQEPQFNFVGKYAFYISNLFVISFYSYLVPLLSLQLMCIYTVQYWVDKYVLIHRSSNSVDFNFQLARTTFKICEISLLISAIGAFIYSNIVNNDTSPIIVINLIVASIYVFLAVLSPKFIERKLFFSNISIEEMSYTECLQQKKFKNAYWTNNPGTKFAQETDCNNQKEFVNYQEAINISYQEQLLNAVSPDKINLLGFAMQKFGQEQIIPSYKEVSDEEDQQF